MNVFKYSTGKSRGHIPIIVSVTMEYDTKFMPGDNTVVITRKIEVQ